MRKRKKILQRKRNLKMMKVMMKVKQAEMRTKKLMRLMLTLILKMLGYKMQLSKFKLATEECKQGKE